MFYSVLILIFQDTSKLRGFFLSKTVTIQLLGSMSLQRFLYKMKLSKQFVIELTFYSVFFFEPEEGWFFWSYTIMILLTGSILISFFLREKFWSSNLLFNEKAFSARKKFSRALFTSCVTREVGGKLYFSTLSHK